MARHQTRRVVNATAALLLFGCAIWQPGTDPQGRELIARGNELAAALEAFRGSTGRYPANLQELPSKFELGRPGSDFHFGYETHQDTYRLYLNYAPSWPQVGLVSCGFEPGASGWGCHGYL